MSIIGYYVVLLAREVLVDILTYVILIQIFIKPQVLGILEGVILTGVVFLKIVVVVRLGYYILVPPDKKLGVGVIQVGLSLGLANLGATMDVQTGQVGEIQV